LKYIDNFALLSSILGAMFNLFVTQNGKPNCISHLLFIDIFEFNRSRPLSSKGHMPPFNCREDNLQENNYFWSLGDCGDKWNDWAV